MNRRMDLNSGKVMAPLIEIIDLVTNFYTYEGVVKALNRVSLTVERGVTFGLVGESGCGKSVLVRSLLRLIPEPGRIDGGKVLLHLGENGAEPVIDVLAQSEAYLQGLRGDRISMIFQEPSAALNPTMSIGEQVAESFLFHRQKEMCAKILADLALPQGAPPWALAPVLRGLYQLASRHPGAWIFRPLSKLPLVNRWRRRLQREALARSVEILRQLGIAQADEVVRSYPHQLSGGMKQRVVIAIALACQPTLLIADEATSNLDVTIQAQILELLRELKKSQIASILLITHDLGVVAETCDRVAVMYAGNICEVADVRDLFSAARHPYTRALLDAVPRFSQRGELKSIDGSVPNLVNPPSGCRFHPRCGHAMPICRRHVPAQVEVATGHLVSCYLHTERPR
jgi:peptide/nickel transport system ATP-binding protein